MANASKTQAKQVRGKPFPKGHHPKTEWKPGQSGNPNGRRNAITDTIRRLADKNNNREKILDKVIELALNGEPWAIKFMAEYDQGKPIQTTYTIEEKMEPIKGIDVS